MGFSRQEYWSGLPFPPLGNLPDQESRVAPCLVCSDHKPRQRPHLEKKITPWVFLGKGVGFHCEQGFPGGIVVKHPPASVRDAGDLGSIPRLGRSPRGGHATHSSILAWRIPWTEEPGGLLQSLPSMGSQRSRTRLSIHTYTHGEQDT